MRLIFAIILFTAIGCNSRPKSNQATVPTTTGVSSAPVVVPVRVHGTTRTERPSQTGNSQGGTVHVFKYSGAIQCYPLVAIGLAEMKPQLTNLGIGVHSSFQATDGKEYSEGCHSPTGEMNVYVIDKTHLQISENQAGFCECTPDPSRPGVCVPYAYASAPPNECRGIVITK